MRFNDEQPYKNMHLLPCEGCGERREDSRRREETGDHLCPACTAAQVVDEIPCTDDETTTYNGWVIRKTTNPWAIELLGAVWEAVYEGHAEYSHDLYELMLDIAEGKTPKQIYRYG